MKRALFLSAFASFVFHIAFSQEKGYYRNPSIHQDIVVFTAEGDLWKYDQSKNLTTRLTTHPGMETNPVISPDGKQIVFTGQYEGVTELYLMSIDGGVPKRLTYDFDNRYMKPASWTNDGKIMYITARYNNLPDPQLVKLDPVTHDHEVVSLAQASDGCYDASGRLYFSRLPKQPSSNKRYVGGLIQQIWSFNGKQEAKCLTCDFDGTSYEPMLYKDRIFFASDRDGSMNIWSMDKDGKTLKQHTFSREWDVKSPAIYGSQIVYQRGADIWVYDIEANKEKMLDINITSDFDQRKPRWFKNPGESISYTTLSPEGNFVAVISRGRLFVVPAKGDRWVEISRKSGIRIREVQFVSEKTLAYISDESGEFEIWKTAADGSGTPQQLTKNSKVLMYSLNASPNGKYIAYNDKDEVLRIIDAATGAVKFEYHDKDYGIGGKSWSADGEYFSFSHSIANQNSVIDVVDVSNGKDITVTTTRADSRDASWSKDNHWMYFLSDRNFKTKVNSPWGPREPEPYYTQVTNIFAFQVSGNEKFPFVAKDPWATDSSSNTSAPNTDKKAMASKPSTAAIDWVEKSKALYQVPVKGSNIRGMDIADGAVYWLDYGDGSDATTKLFALKTNMDKKPTPVEVATGVDNFELSKNKKKMLLVKGGTMAVVDANAEKVDLDKNKIELANWDFQVDPVEDWKEMFVDAWRMMRDYFYDRNLHHIDWVAIRKQHETLLPRITDRYELDDLLAQMVSELSALHTFVAGGDKRKSPDEIQAGFLGAALAKDAKGLKIAHIYRSDPDYPEDGSPLAKAGLNIKEGDIITSVNDISVKDATDISTLLANKIGVPVKLTLLNRSMASYDEVVKPFSAQNETMLRYNEWEYTRRQIVESTSKDDIGYIHLKSMGPNDIDDFVKQFYPVFNRKGLIIDVRHNTGGNIDSWVLEKLLRKAWFYWQDRTGKPYWNMQYAFRGHMVVLCDQFTASDGEAFTEGFKRLGLGKAIGMRTWGGEIWLSADNRLVDNGIATAAETGVFGPESKWLIEGHGVDPDFVVDNLPHETFLGKDAQLDYAIDYLKKKIEKEPIEDPKVPAYPDKSFKYKAF